MRPHLFLIALVGVFVPRRIRADWREEWEAELRHRERLLSDWDHLTWAKKRELLRRSSSAFWDALWLQRQRWEDDVVQDFRFGVRTLFKNPAFAAVAILTLGLGIGANTAIFSYVNALLLRPLGGVADPGRLVQIGRQYADKSYLSDPTYPDFLDYAAQNRVTSGLAAISPAAFHLSTGRASERVDAEHVSGAYFDVLGVTPSAGRLLTAADDRDDAPERVAVISFRLWQRHFAGQPGALGTRIRLDGHEFLIVGVADPLFTGIRIGTPRDVWVPIRTLRQTNPGMAARFDQRRASWLLMFGRLKAGVTLDQARAEFSAIAQRLEQAYPDTNARAGAGVEPGLGRDPGERREVRRFASVPLVAVGIVLLIACANVAGLQLARAAVRQKEIATRLAVGAGRIRVIRQLLVENLTLALAGGVAGLVIGGWLTGWLRNLLPERYLFLSFDLDFGGDWRVFGFTLAIASATGLVFGLVPAFQASRPDVVRTLKGSRLAGPHSGIVIRSALVMAQVALSLILLIAAGLSVRTLHNAAAIDTGYQIDQVLTARFDLPKQKYSRVQGEDIRQQLLDRLHAAPGVHSAGFAATLPLNDGRWQDSIRREGDPTRIQTFQNLVSPRYFEVMRIPVIAGRTFRVGDDSRTPLVAVLNQTLARQMWPDQNPLGRRLTFKGQSLEVIGVVRDIKGRNLFEPGGPMIYFSLLQEYHPAAVLHVRTTVPPEQIAEVVRREAQALDRDLPIYAVKTLSEHMTATLTPQRLLAHLISGFGLLALLLAGIGLYGLLTYLVAERTSEIGVRMALGAQRRDVTRLFVARGMRLALAGVALGVAAAAGLTHLLASMLFGVSPLDPLTFAIAPGVLILAALTACAVPASRAARADPKIALRCE